MFRVNDSFSTALICLPAPWGRGNRFITQARGENCCLFIWAAMINLHIWPAESRTRTRSFLTCKNSIRFSCHVNPVLPGNAQHHGFGAPVVLGGQQPAQRLWKKPEGCEQMRREEGAVSNTGRKTALFPAPSSGMLSPRLRLTRCRAASERKG